MSEQDRPSNAAFAQMRKDLAEAKKELGDLQAFRDRDQRQRVAFFMAQSANLSEAGTRLMVTYAREQDGDLRDFLQTVVSALTPENGSKR